MTYRVLEVLGSLGHGGAESMVLNYSRKLPGLGVRVDFLVHAKGDASYEAVAEGLGGNIYYVETPGKLGPIKYVREMLNVLRDSGPFNVVHAHTNAQSGLVMAAAKLAHVPIRIPHSHNTVFNCSQAQLHINRALVNCFATNRLACGEEAGRALYGNKPFLVINNAINVDDYIYCNHNDLAYRHSLGIDDDACVVGHVGRFVPQKNHEFILALASKAKKQGLNAVFVLVGDGRKMDEMKDLVESSSLLVESVKFLGIRDDMPDLYSMFDVLLLPSRFEGLPLTLVEAQSSSLHCLVSEAVTTECDLGLDLLEYLPLDEDIWFEKLVSCMNQNRVHLNPDLIKSAAKRYDSNEQIRQLAKCYQIPERQ